MKTLAVHAPIEKSTNITAKSKGMKTTPTMTHNTTLSTVEPQCYNAKALQTTPHNASLAQAKIGAEEKGTNEAIRLRAATQRSQVGLTKKGPNYRGGTRAGLALLFCISKLLFL
jgi:hypothetical protein